MSFDLIYLPPHLQNFAGDYEGEASDRFSKKHEGCFLVTARKNEASKYEIKLWAVGASYTHNCVYIACDLMKNPTSGRLLGGGRIQVDKSGSPVNVYGASGDFGGVSAELLREYFVAVGLTVTVDTFKATREETLEWLARKGVVL